MLSLSWPWGPINNNLSPFQKCTFLFLVVGDVPLIQLPRNAQPSPRSGISLNCRLACHIGVVGDPTYAIGHRNPRNDGIPIPVPIREEVSILFIVLG